MTRTKTHVAAALLSLGLLAGCGAGDETDLVATDPTSEAGSEESTEATASAEPSETATAEESPSATPPASEGPDTRTAEMIVLAKPAEGAAVSGSFEAAGKADSFEANVIWEVQDPSGTKVLEGYATAEGWGGQLYPWSTTVDVSGLEPGQYVFVARTDDPSGGSEGPGADEVSANITVE